MQSQNLIPNPSFEDYIECPFTYGQIWKAYDWGNVTNHLGSPDYYNSCDTSSTVSVPINLWDTIYSASGNAHAGIILLAWGDFREYITARLTEELKKGYRYFISLQYQLCRNCGYATDALGIYLSEKSITGDSTDFYLPYVPQIINSSLLNNRIEWETLTFEYIAKGIEQYITIGNFQQYDSSVLTIDLGSGSPRSYIYIDDLAIYMDSCQIELDLGNDTVLCIGDTIQLKTNLPLSTDYNWNNGNTGSKLQVYDGGIYWVKSTNACGEQADSILIELDDCQCRLYIPNTFTPNLDNVNDVLQINSNCPLSEFTFSIFNRWGDEVYNSNDIYSYWDGTHNGKRAKDGIYGYKIQYKFQNESLETLMGSVKLLR